MIRFQITRSSATSTERQTGDGPIGRAKKDPIADDEAVLKTLRDSYGYTREEALNTLLKYDGFARRDHEKLIGDTAEALECDGKIAADVIVRSLPLFMKNPKRTVDRGIAIGATVMVPPKDVRRLLIVMPKLGAYSDGRYNAVMEVAEELGKEGIPKDSSMFMAWLRRVGTSPYVPGTGKLSISEAKKQGVYDKEPPLLVSLRRYLTRQQGGKRGAGGHGRHRELHLDFYRPHRRKNGQAG